MGVHVMAGRGSGKSRLLGRIISWQDFLRGIPLVIIDPVGTVIDNLLDKLARLSFEQQHALGVSRRVRYVDMAGAAGRVVPFPLYYRLADESLYAVSQRYLDAVRLMDPNLMSASVEGWNSLWRTGTYIGMLLAAGGWGQITEAESLLTNPLAWRDRVASLPNDIHGIGPARQFYHEMCQWDERTRNRKAGSFINKASLFALDPTLSAMFGAESLGIDWSKVIQERQVVLIDLRRVHDIERRQFLLLWVFLYLMEYLKSRGPGRHSPISVVIDELAAIVGNHAGAGESAIGQLIDEVIQVYMRGFSIWLTVAHQEAFQLDERSLHAVMSMGTQILGVTTDQDAALALARQFFPIDVRRVKSWERVWGHSLVGDYVIENRPLFFTVEEQHYISAEYFKGLGLFEFVVRPAMREGDVTGRVLAVSIKNLDRGQWINEPVVAEARARLAERVGIPVSTVLAQIESRTSRLPQSVPHLSPPAFDILEDDDDIIYDEK